MLYFRIIRLHSSFTQVIVTMRLFFFCCAWEVPVHCYLTKQKIWWESLLLLCIPTLDFHAHISERVKSVKSSLYLQYLQMQSNFPPQKVKYCSNQKCILRSKENQVWQGTSYILLQILLDQFSLVSCSGMMKINIP